jgi:hypothetical protein
MATRRADVISVKDLSRTVDRAVALATKRHGVKTEPGSLIVNWEIVGRILREFQDANAAFEFASDVTRSVKLQGIKAQPAIFKMDRDILCGFIERGQLPRRLGP